MASPVSTHATGRRWHRRRLGLISLLIAGAMVLAAWGFGAVSGDEGPPPLSAAVDPLLPDLAMGPIEDIAVGTTENGDTQLRFAASIVNLGEGEFLVRGSRSVPFTDDWVVRQLVSERGAGYTERLTDAHLVFGGDGHGHWHVEHVEAHQLETLDGVVLGRLVKQGFCFFDTDAYRALTGSPSDRHWSARGCAGQFDTRVRMGLSVGWSDKYPWYLLDERIDITTVADGEYVIRQIADPSDHFIESDESNNETWVRVELFTRTDGGFRDVRVLEPGPAP